MGQETDGDTVITLGRIVNELGWSGLMLVCVCAVCAFWKAKSTLAFLRCVLAPTLLGLALFGWHTFFGYMWYFASENAVTEFARGGMLLAVGALMGAALSLWKRVDGCK